MSTVLIEGIKYISGTRIPVDTIISLYNKEKRELKEEAYERIHKFIREEGYIVPTKTIEKVIEENVAH